MGYRIGLDIGITSIGYSILKTDNEGNPIKIKELNSVIFPIAENPKDGSSLALPRREKRGARRRNRRTKFRKHRTKMLFVRYQLLTINQIQEVFEKKLKESSIYELRTKALEELISNEELFRILYFFSGHRGFKSNRKSELQEKDMGPVLTAIREMETKIDEGSYSTLGEYIYKDEKYQHHKRNKEGKDRYLGTALRALNESEIKLIIDMQRKLGNNLLTDEFELKYIGNSKQTGIFNDQRDFDEGPASGPYSGNQVEKMIGNCTFEEQEKRAAKASYTFQYFELLSKINNLKYQEKIGEPYHELTEFQRNLVKEKALATKELKFSTLKKLLDLSAYSRFNLLSYGSVSTIEETEKKSTFSEMKAYNRLKKNLPNDFFTKLTENQLDDIGFALTAYSSDKSRNNFFFGKMALSDDIVELLLPINFSKFGNLSIKAMKNILPYLEMGYTYDKACEAAGYDFRYKKIDRKHIHENVNNPVVKRAVSQTIKVVDTIIRKYGQPDAISIELARELGKTHEERKKIVKRQEENQSYNQKIANKLEELGFTVNGENITRLKLWEEQKNLDPYTGKVIPFESIFSREYEVDHIIPYSMTFDDSYTNKVLTSAKSNQEKSNKIPMEYLAGNMERIQKLEVVAKGISNIRKREKLIKKEMTPEDIDGWKTRNLNDTRYISRLVHSYFNHNISFSDLNIEKKQRVFAVNGAITAKLRARWGFSKIRESGDKHHALDAVVIACVTPKYVREVTNFSKRKELRFNKEEWERKEIIEEIEAEVVSNKKDYNRIFNKHFPEPWPQFSEEVKCRLSDAPNELMKNYTWETYSEQEIEELKPIFIVRIPNKKITGPAHLDTIRSAKLLADGKTISRTSIDKLKLNKEGKIVSGKGTFYQPLDNGWLPLYQALKNEMEKHEGEGSKAFPDGEFVYEQDGQQHVARKVKIVSKSTISAPLNDGKATADNGSMVRIDVFKTPKKYIFVPIYIKDTVEKELPNLACVPLKPLSDWQEVNEEEFLFSLYSGDMIHIEHKSGFKPIYSVDKNKDELDKIQDFWGYYNGADIYTASIQVKSHDNSYTGRGIGLATLLNIEKYQIDYFGNYNKVKEKTRQKFKK